MLAVVSQSGKQYRLKIDQFFVVNKIDSEVGSTVNLDSVKMIVGSDGTPSYNTGSVTAEVMEQKRGEKLVVFKKRRRKNSRRKNGHRQYLTLLKVKDIKI